MKTLPPEKGLGAEKEGRLMSELVKLMNMCMVMDGQGRVLVQNRKKNDWDGLTFPGGKVEPGESLTRAVIREVLEETGLTIVHPKIVGVKEWHHPETGRNIVLFYRADEFSGELKDSNEGHMEWMTLEEMKQGNMALDMDGMLRVFLEDDVAEFWYEYHEDGTWETMLL